MEQETNDLIKSEIENNDVCLFMKGTPDAPQCGFSMATSNILKGKCFSRSKAKRRYKSI